MRKGNVSFESIFKLIQTDSNLRCVRSTFAGYWKKANEQYAGILQREIKEKNDLLLEAVKNESKKGFLSRDDKLKILSEIASGDIINDGEKKISPNFRERILAIRELNRMSGDHSAVRVFTNIPIAGYTLFDGDDLLQMMEKEK